MKKENEDKHYYNNSLYTVYIQVRRIYKYIKRYFIYVYIYYMYIIVHYMYNMDLDMCNMVTNMHNMDVTWFGWYDDMINLFIKGKWKKTENKNKKERKEKN